jgi:hypothetical protein
MKTTLSILSLLLLFNCSSEEKNNYVLLVGSWKVESLTRDFDNQSSEKIELSDCSEFIKHTYFKDGAINFTMPKRGDPSCNLNDKNFWTGTWGIINDSTLVTRNKISYQSGHISSYCSERTFKFINKNTLEIVLNYENDGVVMDNEHIIGETSIHKRIELL